MQPPQKSLTPLLSLQNISFEGMVETVWHRAKPLSQRRFKELLLLMRTKALGNVKPGWLSWLVGILLLTWLKIY